MHWMLMAQPYVINLIKVRNNERMILLMLQSSIGNITIRDIDTEVLFIKALFPSQFNNSAVAG